MTSVRTGLSLAATAAFIAMSVSAPTFARESAPKGETAKVHCYGVNSCKGTSDCKTAKNDCRGQNDCKGHGFKEMTKAQCAAAGGSLTEPK
ncbi:hypothetical protein [Caulobacter mirabilis]|uniref:DUF2282 domain-containing protein n=1 Tax=Caulobacter mirabilis TaxID=69666 RepID=A0A2D2B2Z6_9CAUL|nr:hypothetical protein [Caulobacter mirabilis]ATQ44618.1 hypothetical protein CSW64_20615 [Caulobacter mirabilis]